MNTKAAYLFPFLLIAYTIIGLWITPDYGFSIDEAVQRDHGLVSMHYASSVWGTNLACIEGQKDVDFRNYTQRYYGTLFQMVAVSLECVLDLNDWRSRYLLRHYLVFLLFSASAFILYFIISDLTKETTTIFICLAIYLFHPRIFAHAHYNPKDLVLLSCYTWAIYTLYKVYKETTIWNLVMHGCLTALVINIRIVGLILVPVTVFLLIVKHWDDLKKLGFNVFNYLTTTTIVTITLWPLLWEDPYHNFIWAFKSMSQFPWLKDLIYWGEAVPSVEAPWTYFFSWFGITTPFFFLLLFIVALIYLGISCIKDFRKHVFTICLFGLTLGPVAAVLIFDSILYGDWRHLYFIYPGLVLLSAIFLSKLENHRIKILKYLYIILIIQSMYIMGWTVKNHPYQYNYFNLLGQNELGLHEQDYWGVSYKNVMEKLVNDYLGLGEKVIVGSPDFSWNPDKADYFVTNYRTLPDINAYRKKQHPYEDLLFEIMVDFVPICGVYKMR